jgi:glucokinase
VLIGDVGGTNVRFELVKLFHDDQDKRVVLKKLTKFNPQVYDSFYLVLEEFLKDVPSENYPKFGVVGMAGPVVSNTIPLTVNIPRWPVSDGVLVAKQFNLKSFTFINDFTAAGYGVSRIKPSQCFALNKSSEV